MHARVTTFEATDIAAIEAQIDGLAEKTAQIPGLLKSNVVWGEDGKGVLMAIYPLQVSVCLQSISYRCLD